MKRAAAMGICKSRFACILCPITPKCWWDEINTSLQSGKFCWCVPLLLTFMTPSFSFLFLFSFIFCLLLLLLLRNSHDCNPFFISLLLFVLGPLISFFLAIFIFVFSPFFFKPGKIPFFFFLLPFLFFNASSYGFFGPFCFAVPLFLESFN